MDKIKERLNNLLDHKGYYCPSEDIPLLDFLIESGLAEGESMRKDIHDNICVIYPEFNGCSLSGLADCYWYCLVDEVVLLKGMLIITLQDRYPSGLPEDFYRNMPNRFEVY